MSKPFLTRIFGGNPSEPETDHISEIMAALATIQAESAAARSEAEGARQEVRKLGKAQYKANTLVEGQSTRWEATATKLQETQSENTHLVQRIAEQTNDLVRQDLLQALFPAIDGIDQAFIVGYSYLQRRDLDIGLRELWPSEQQPMQSAEDRAAMAAWLDGLRVVRGRLLGVLAADGVTRIPTIGESFDPYLHIAVGTVAAEAESEKNYIASEQKAGYRNAQGVLRYAEVIVKK